MKRAIPLVMSILLATNFVFSQTTYYSRNTTSGGAWNSTNSWTTNSDGSGGPTASVPQRNDNIVVLNGHTISIGATNDNGSSGQSPNGLSESNIGSFAGAGTAMFYQTGDITINSGGTLDVNVGIMIRGKTVVRGTMDASGDLVNIGRLDVFSGTFSVGDDFILSGFSETNIDISSTSSDDIYLDHSDALLCGNGDLTVGDQIQELNGADADSQVCDSFTINGCSGTPSCPFTGGGGFTLPVELLFFKVENVGNYANVVWSTASELNNDYFIIERSKDGLNFEFLEKIDGAGTKSITTDYSYIDKDPFLGWSYYRLKQTDFDGTTKTYDVVFFELKGRKTNSIIYPNPIHENRLNLKLNGFASNSNVSIFLLSIDGKVIESKRFTSDRFGNLQATLTPSHVLKKGMYILKTQGLSNYSLHKFSVE